MQGKAAADGDPSEAHQKESLSNERLSFLDLATLNYFLKLLTKTIPRDMMYYVTGGILWIFS